MNATFTTNPINSVTSPRNLTTSLPDFGSLLSSPRHVEASSSSYDQDDGEEAGHYQEDEHDGKDDGSVGGRRAQDGRGQIGDNDIPNYDYTEQSSTQEAFLENDETTFSNQTIPHQRRQSNKTSTSTSTTSSSRQVQKKKTPEEDDPLNLKRKRISEMTADERVQWSRMQSRDHSRRSRLRRKQLEADLRVQIDQLQSFRTLIEDSYQLVSIHSLDSNAVFLYANSVYFRALNHIPQELIDVPVRELAHPDDVSELEKAISTIRTDDESTPNITLEWRIKARENFPGENLPAYVHVISSISLNQQGIVIFSMIKNDMLSSHSFSLEALSLVAANEMSPTNESSPDNKNTAFSSDPSFTNEPISLTSV